MPRVGELLFEFYREHDHKFFRCELRDHGKYAVEAQFYEGGEFFLGRRFDPSLDPTQPPRVMAIEWAEAEQSLHNVTSPQSGQHNTCVDYTTEVL